MAFLDKITVNGTLYDMRDSGAYRKPSSGIPATDLSSSLQSEIDSFITASVDNLTNYYLKSETYTKSETQSLIAAINQFHYEIYPSTSAVTSPASNVLYLIGPSGSGSDLYEEYVYTTTWVKIGDTSIDLSGYVTIAALNTALGSYYTKTQTDALLEDTPDFVEEGLSQELEDEYDRVLRALYQALTDAGVQTTAAQQAAALAQAKATLANNAASAANSAASSANDAASLANTKATYANAQGDYAKTQGDYAKTQIDGAKGSFGSLDARLDYIEQNAGNIEFVEDNTANFDF